MNGPKKHSQTSRTSDYPKIDRPVLDPNKQHGIYERRTSARPRINQPLGYILLGTQRPRMYYGRRHDYMYYPESWTDKSTGTSYQKGYYDENGQYYSDVSFKQDGKYQNVVCRCPYCEQTTILNLDKASSDTLNLQCPHCMGQMEIQSELDEILEGQKTDNTANESIKNQEKTKKKNTKNTIIIIAAILCLLIARHNIKNRFQNIVHQNIQPIETVQLVDNNSESFVHGVQIIPGQPVFLELQQDGYHVVNDVLRADKTLEWSDAYDSWYDPTTDCYLWYNTDVEPPVWQYWYEGISSDYGDYGWMEFDGKNWYIESYEGNWILLPNTYSTENLWEVA